MKCENKMGMISTYLREWESRKLDCPQEDYVAVRGHFSGEPQKTALDFLENYISFNSWKENADHTLSVLGVDSDHALYEFIDHKKWGDRLLMNDCEVKVFLPCGRVLMEG